MGISEKTARELSEIMQKNLELSKKSILELDSLFNEIIKNKHLELKLKEASYLLKLKSSIFLTRWFWEYKYNKIHSKVLKIENDPEFKKFLKKNKP